MAIWVFSFYVDIDYSQLADAFLRRTIMVEYTIHPLVVGLNETDQGVMTYLRDYGKLEIGRAHV